MQIDPQSDFLNELQELNHRLDLVFAYLNELNAKITETITDFHTRLDNLRNDR